MPSCISSGRASSSGGLVGYNNWGTIRDVYATGMIHSSGDDSDSGGLVGYSDRSAIHDTYALGSIYSNSDAYATGATRCAGNDCPAGGLIGIHQTQTGAITHIYTISNGGCTGIFCFFVLNVRLA